MANTEEAATQALATLLAIVNAGGTLVLCGPEQLGNSAHPGPFSFGVTVESSTGARCANGYGETLEAAILQTAEDWRGQEIGRASV